MYLLPKRRSNVSDFFDAFLIETPLHVRANQIKLKQIRFEQFPHFFEGKSRLNRSSSSKNEEILNRVVYNTLLGTFVNICLRQNIFLS